VFSHKISNIFQVPAKYFTGGFGNKVTKALEDKLRSDKYGVNFVMADVFDVRPSHDAVKAAVIVQTQPPQEFDRIILTSIWSSIGTGNNDRDRPYFFKGLPQELLSQVTNVNWSLSANPCIVSIPVIIEGTDADVVIGDIVMCDSIGKWNYPFAIYNNLHQNQYVYQCLCTVDSRMPRKQALDLCKKNIIHVFKEIYDDDADRIKVGFAGDNLSNDGLPGSGIYWCPLQPNVTPTQFLNGFYNAFEGQQGKGGLYYCNIFTYFNYTGLVTQYATQLVQRKF